MFFSRQSDNKKRALSFVQYISDFGDLVLFMRLFLIHNFVKLLGSRSDFFLFLLNASRRL